jgi:uncharacterized phage-associated protein
MSNKLFNVIQYLISLVEIETDEEGMTNLRLQKLLYYCQGFYLAMKNKPLYEDPIYAWRHGPVIPDVYYHYKEYGPNPIPISDNFDFNSLTDEEKNIISEVYSVFGQYSAWGLRNKTHIEKPWANTNSGKIISKERMKEYFKTQIEQ